MSLAFALMAASNGSTGSCTTLTCGLYGTKPGRRQSGGSKDSHCSEAAAQAARVRPRGVGALLHDRPHRHRQGHPRVQRGARRAASEAGYTDNGAPEERAVYTPATTGLRPRSRRPQHRGRQPQPLGRAGISGERREHLRRVVVGRLRERHTACTCAPMRVFSKVAPMPRSTRLEPSARPRRIA
jgi:hypothetical protein